MSNEVTIDRRDHPIDELSALFDEIDVGGNLDADNPSDYGTASTKDNLRPFNDRVEDLHAVMEHEPDPEPEITKDSPEREAETEPKDEKPEPEPDFDPSEFEPEEPKSEPEPTLEPELTSAASDVKEDGDPNPLGLNDIDLRAYHAIQKKYPQFQVYDGTHAFREFYRYKIKALKSALTSFPVLPLSDMRKELEAIKTQHKSRADLSDPVSLGQKMGECSVARGRIAELLLKALAQAPLWKTTLALLNGKVWKDHDTKGAHKREGLIMEHNYDVERYDAELRGFINAATHIDNFFQSQFDSYSRQLTRIDVQSKVGVVHSAIANEIEKPAEVQPDSDLDGLDTIESGTVIPRVRKGGLVQRDFPGAEIDEFLDGIG